MDTKDIIQLIKACRANGVHELVFDKLRLSFSPEAVPHEVPSLVPDHTPVKVPQKVERAMDEVAQEAREVERKKEIEDEIDTLIITDPLQYEENLASGEFVDEARLQH